VLVTKSAHLKLNLLPHDFGTQVSSVIALRKRVLREKKTNDNKQKCNL